MELPIYFDNNATTAVDPDVLGAMMPYFHKSPGNPGSMGYSFGWEAEEAVEKGRESAAKLIGASPSEIIFTSCATESINMALKGMIELNSKKKIHIITVSTEHKAVLETCLYLQKKGSDLTILPVDNEGLIDLNRLESSIKSNTALIAVMLANNESGVIQPLKSISKIARNNGALLFCDATQAVGKIPLSVNELGIDMLAASAHKLYGPKGVGALFINKKSALPEAGSKLPPLMHGGGQEKGLRSGTLNVSGIAGFGKACDLCLEKATEEFKSIAALKAVLERSLLEISGSAINGNNSPRLPNTINISFENIDAQLLIEAIHKDIAIATGSACNAESHGPSYVLMAMGLSPGQIQGSIRISIGRFNTAEEVRFAANRIKEAISILRKWKNIS